ncbi:hypothetical protein [Francisella sp. SYW-9]|uniref:hypothetical protein n=1 Tax=Francisella sp. SYW-9 TaxID=2610888 RepID=UPI00123D75B2|nr:hypothetical protein [Francisella sp. SYW-9]
MILFFTRDGGVSRLVMVSMVLVQLNRPFELIATSLREIIIAKGMVLPLQDQFNKHRKPHENKNGFTLHSDKISITLSNLSYSYKSKKETLFKPISCKGLFAQPSIFLVFEIIRNS